MSPAKRGRRDTPPPATASDEKAVQRGFLDYLRASVEAKVTGVPEPDLRMPGVPSGTNLLGLVNHLTFVERFTFLGEPVADWSKTFHADPDANADAVLDRYRHTVSEVNEVINACDDLSNPVNRPTKRGQAPAMRWALTT
jgi:hypothetical protein